MYVNMETQQINNCKRCSHEWIKRVEKTQTCPKCKSYYWNADKSFDRRTKEVKQRELEEQDTTKSEKLQINIDEIDKDIDNLNLVIQQVSNIKDDVCNGELRDNFYNFIDGLDSKIRGLEAERDERGNELNYCLNNEKNA